MADCCPAGSWPALAPPEGYVPKGETSALDDLPIYTSGNPESKKAVIVLPEVFGWAGRLKGICDTLAAEGYYVMMPDCHRGTTKDSTPDFGKWLMEYSWESKVAGDFAKMLSHLETRGITSTGAIGFCWGAWALCKASSSGVPLKCGVGPHPSTRLEGMMGGDELAMMKGLNMPVLLMPAGGDPDNLKPGGDVAAAVEAKGGSSYPFPDMAHGWMSRGDLSDTNVKRDVEEAMGKALAHFKANL